MKGIVAVFTVAGVWVALMAVAAVVTLVTYAGTILLLLALVGAIGAVIGVVVVAVCKAPHRVAQPARGYRYPPHQTYPVYSGVLYYPAALRGAGWQGQSWWTPVAPPPATVAVVEAEPAGGEVSARSPLAQRRYPSRFSGRAGGHR